MAAVIRAAFGYFFLVFMVRVVGRRPGKQMNPFEFVLIFFIGGLHSLSSLPTIAPFRTHSTQIITIALSHLFLVLIRQRSNWVARFLDGNTAGSAGKRQMARRNMRNMLIGAGRRHERGP